MDLLLPFTTICAVILMVVAILNWYRCHKLSRDLESANANLKKAEKEVLRLQDELSRLKSREGIGESSVLSLIGDISRIENNLYHMQDVPGRKQVAKAIDRMKVTLQAEDYTIVRLLGTEYKEGMQVTAVFIADEGLPEGTSVITSVQRPQINYAGRMIQAASVTVAQNI